MLTRRLAVALTAASALFMSPAAAHAASPRLSPTERAVVRLMNRARARHGIPALRASAPLARAADGHSRDMIAHDFFAHESSDGTSFDRRVRAYAPAREIGENLAMVSRVRRVARRVVSMWLHSPPHRAVLLSADYRRVGVGERSGRLGAVRATVVTVDFASRR
jgi:uncharacterized protein YkwD